MKLVEWEIWLGVGTYCACHDGCVMGWYGGGESGGAMAVEVVVVVAKRSWSGRIGDCRLLLVPSRMCLDPEFTATQQLSIRSVEYKTRSAYNINNNSIVVDQLIESGKHSRDRVGASFVLSNYIGGRQQAIPNPIPQTPQFHKIHIRHMLS